MTADGAPAPAPATIRVDSPNVVYTDTHIYSRYTYSSTRVATDSAGTVTATPVATDLEFRVERQVPRVGLMMVGWGGNNGSTLTASILANQRGLSWATRTGDVAANYLGSITQSSTLKLGVTAAGDDAFVPFSAVLPMLRPNDLVVSGWDISGANLADAARRAQVLEPDLLRQLQADLAKLAPLPSIYIPDFIAANQSERADNVLAGTRREMLEQIRSDMRAFRASNALDKVIIVWTANTERFADVVPGVNDTSAALLDAIARDHAEVSPSTIFAVAAVLEGCPFINGSPQNTLVPGAVALASERGVFVGGDDFKSGQTKLKSVLVDFLVNAGIKPLAITSYNHLGNNDGLNLSAPQQFRSKEISKSNVVDDAVASNPILYKADEKPDHTVVIKYCPAVGDSKRALDEYVSEIFMGGRNVLSIYNVCEDSLLATPLIIDLVVLTELMTRVTYREAGAEQQFKSFHAVLSILSYMLKAPTVPPGTPVVNALGRQRGAIENLLRACVSLPPVNDLVLERMSSVGRK